MTGNFQGVRNGPCIKSDKIRESRLFKNEPSRCGRVDEKGFIMRFGARRVRFPPSHDFEKSAFDFFAYLAVAAFFGCGNCGRRCDAGKEKHHRKSSCFEVAACARALAACAAI